ncbi:MAG: hypothetical protein RLZZ553_742 [Verrucomicrobiota bacterium]|jgi:hypothetical protein
MKRLFLTPIGLALVLGLVLILPRRGDVAPTSLSHKTIDMENLTPPLHVGDWMATAAKPSEKEVSILNPDTTFIKGVYQSYDMPPLYDGRGRRFDNAINLSIVISGFDINNSIHRPERCLRAQGHIDMLSLPSPLTTPAGKKILAQRLSSTFPLAPENDGEKPFPIGFVSYYYFVGNKHITHDHWSRTLLDMKDRLLLGTDQQWSFVMLSMPYNLGSSVAQTERNRDHADKKIRQLLGELTDVMIDWDAVSAD